MKIILSENEIIESIQEFIKKSMAIPEDKEFVIDVSSSRGVGVTAEISIENKKTVKSTPIAEEVKEESPITPIEEVKEEEEEEPKPVKKSFFANLS